MADKMPMQPNQPQQPIQPAPQPPQPEQAPQAEPQQPQADAVDIFSETESKAAPGGAPQQAPTMQQTILTPKEQDELFKREKLSTVQKLILIIIAVLVIAGLVGGGIWLYLTLTKDSGAQPEAVEVIEEGPVNEEIVIIDTDKDGLTDLEEEKYGSDPNKKDSDGDGFNDGEEVKNGFDPMGPGKLK
ncbi:hypothetical protein KKC88_01810 [Patescibacteria group bacterium]|nr:hypothetical protein [Patescibacteria group bacterium]MBU1673857.1 hypothetical protein [Patescibacteria group bacterium]MBU1963234.1 hypothetical protein [Patescibacteria group bacterium]